jgi:subtilase family serine protease
MNRGGWYQVGGTSLAAPLIAGVYALASDVPTASVAAQLPYLNPSALRDVTNGASSGFCEATYLCTAMQGYDGPTGLGTPNGVLAF